MPFISSVKVLEDKPDLSRWSLKYEVFGRNVEFSWLARNMTPTKNQKIHWRSLEGLPNRGAVRFFPKTPSSCRVQLTVAYEIPEILAPVGSALKPFMEGLLLKGLERFAAFAKERNSKIPQPWRSLQCKNSRIWSVSFPLKHDYHNRRLHIVTADVGKIMCWQRNKRVNIMASMKLKFGSYLSFLFFRYDYASWARCHHKPNVPTGHKENAPSKWLFWVQKNMVDVKCVQSFKDTINKQLNFFCNHLMFM